MIASQSSQAPNRRARVLALAALLALPTALPAGGGPRNVLVVINENSQESQEIGVHYLRGRDIPDSNLCRIRTTENLTAGQAEYQSNIREPIRACIAGSPYAGRIDYIVLTRGMPIRINIPDMGTRNTTPTSIAALLQVMDTTLDDAEQGYDGPFLTRPNPYQGRREYFSHAKSFGGRNLFIATMLSGLWSEDARALVDRSIASDGNPPTAAGGTIILEDANNAANVRNADFPQAVANLQSRGLDALHVTAADPEVNGMVVASHVCGGVYSQNTRGNIDSNTWPPGALVDVLESFGLVPQNFVEDGNYSQVPVTWWVSAGATGAQGTVFEPYNVAFPNGYMLEPYADGYNLGETWYQGIPYLYWMNLVLGDPLAQPYAEPPVVTITAPGQGDTVSGMVQIGADAMTVKPEGIQQLEFFVDDVLLDTIPGDTGQIQWDSTTVPDGPHRIEVIAYEDTPLYTQATAGIDVTVDNQGLWATITDPASLARVSGTFPVTVDTAGGITDVELYAEGLLIGTASGSPPFVVDADAGLLGRGLHTLTAVGRTGAGDSALSPGVDVYVVKAPRVWSPGGVPSIDPPEGPQSGGTLVAIRGWNFEDDIRVFFGAGESGAVTVLTANLLEAVTPPGTAGPVEVRLENPSGGAVAVPDGFTYVAAPCPVTERIPDLTVTREPDGRLRLAWSALADPCLAEYRMHGFVDPDPVLSPVFPDDYTDITDLDEDGDPGSAPGYLHTSAGRLVLYLATGEGTDGSLGPR